MKKHTKIHLRNLMVVALIPLTAGSTIQIDSNCGILAEDVTMTGLGQTIFDFVLEVASGMEVRQGRPVSTT